MKILSSKLTPVKTPLIRIKGSDISVKGAFELPIIIGTPPKMCLTLTKLHGDWYTTGL